ncbi:glycine zipper domain-containing protein [Desulfosediminicola flagellatus]|uniref:glycine zipper domain-containing protein n=1 Tax=Desulfosediminicola flagellatus TaxID=2569541 RepID=UPI0010ACA8C4|nr:glycine zipper domain-containing protein [Desulfosediminicola flagellatus]
MKMGIWVLLLCSSLTLVSCGHNWNQGQSGAAIGAAGGAIAGQAIGHNTEATLIGALVGTVVGYMVGNEMDKYDRRQLNHVYERGVSGQTSSWRNPDNGNSYSVTPRPASGGASGPCREAAIEAMIDGKRQTTYTTACRDYNGQWVLQ